MTEFRSEARVATAHAARYPGQLCRHLAQICWARGGAAGPS
jgi:hypothetical protein